MKRITIKMLLFFGALLWSSAPTQAQNREFAEIGKPAPPFTLKVIDGSSNLTATKTLKDYAGKWLVLDFWSKTCVNCIEEFAKLDSLKDKFAGQANFLLVGINDKKYNSGIEQIYRRIAKAEKLRLHTAFDSTLFKTYRVNGYPHAVVIDPNGVIQTITYGQEITASNLEALFSGRGNFFEAKSGFAKKDKNTAQKTFTTITDSIGNPPHISALAIWKAKDLLLSQNNFAQAYKNGRFWTRATSLKSLYQLAYIGATYWNPKDSINATYNNKIILKTRDSAAFESSSIKEMGLYNYEIKTGSQVPVEKAMQMMQEDLQQWFPYKVSIAEMQTPVYVLKVKDSLKLKASFTKYNKLEILGSHAGMEFRAANISDILFQFYYYHTGETFVDETGIINLIDVKLDTPFTRLEGISSALEEHGLELKKTTRPMRFLVISYK